MVGTALKQGFHWPEEAKKLTLFVCPQRFHLQAVPPSEEAAAVQLFCF